MFSMTAMDHIVLNVRNMEKILHFYQQVLGLEGERLEAFRQGKVPFPSVRINADTVIDLFPTPATEDKGTATGHTDLNHFCMVLKKADMPAFIEHLQKHNVEILEGPANRWGAHGNGVSIYFNDPEERRIEVRYYDE